jgi:sphinganine-1-phosphate aldolase
VCLHVDGCLGGFVLPFVRQLSGTNVPPFDFSVKVGCH